jgi:hypothetical protein
MSNSVYYSVTAAMECCTVQEREREGEGEEEKEKGVCGRDRIIYRSCRLGHSQHRTVTDSIVQHSTAQHG